MRHRWIKEKSDHVVVRIGHSSRRSVTFKKFMGMQKLKKAALAHIATHLTQTELGSLGEIFHDMDEDNDGIMKLHELDFALANGTLTRGLCATYSCFDKRKYVLPFCREFLKC
jgi:hypothetical protein